MGWDQPEDKMPRKRAAVIHEIRESMAGIPL
jgi:hypothetical protein